MVLTETCRSLNGEGGWKDGVSALTGLMNRVLGEGKGAWPLFPNHPQPFKNRFKRYSVDSMEVQASNGFEAELPSLVFSLTLGKV